MKTAIACLALSSCILFVGCGKESQAIMSPAASVADTDPMSITPDKTLLEQLKIGRVSRVPVGQEISVAARIAVDENRVARIGSPVAGRVISLAATVGQYVKQGQPLALVSSTALSEGQLAFLRALTQEQVARRGVERAQILLKAEVIGAAELQRREAEWADAQAGHDAARDQLVLLGMPPESIARLEKDRKLDSTARILATLGGTILKREVTVGQIVQPADSLFEVADLASVWLVADVPSSDAANLAVGQRVEAIVGSPPFLRTTGRLDYVSSTVEQETRTVRVRMSLANSAGRLRPAMLAAMTLFGRTERLPCVPLSAVVREDDQEHVFVQSATSVFVLRPVSLGNEYGNCRPLLGETAFEQPIVLDGAFHLNNERRRRAQRTGGGE